MVLLFNVPSHWLLWANAYMEHQATVGPAQAQTPAAPAAPKPPAAPGAANRNGNYAATATPGQVAKTPAGITGATQQRTESAAKRVGRNISQAGVTRLSNARQEYTRNYAQQFRGN